MTNVFLSMHEAYYKFTLFKFHEYYMKKTNRIFRKKKVNLSELNVGKIPLKSSSNFMYHDFIKENQILQNFTLVKIIWITNKYRNVLLLQFTLRLVTYCYQI